MGCSHPGSSVHEESPGKNTGVGCHALLQGIFPTQGSNQRLQSWSFPFSLGEGLIFVTWFSVLLRSQKNSRVEYLRQTSWSCWFPNPYSPVIFEITFEQYWLEMMIFRICIAIFLIRARSRFIPPAWLWGRKWRVTMSVLQTKNWNKKELISFPKSWLSLPGPFLGTLQDRPQSFPALCLAKGTLGDVWH